MESNDHKSTFVLLRVLCGKSFLSLTVVKGFSFET
jgi:hypothetical protein